MEEINTNILIRVEISNNPSKPRLDFRLSRIPCIGEEIELEDGRLLKVCRVIHKLFPHFLTYSALAISAWMMINR